MEPAQAKPNQKRRRWLIVTLLLVLVSAVSWWYWPRGDARFVGKWAATYSKSELRPKTAVWELSSNGTGRELVSTARKSIWFSWSAHGEVMQTGYDPPESAKAWVESVAQRVFNWTWHTLAPAKVTYRIMSVSPDEIRMRFEDESVTLTRIPE